MSICDLTIATGGPAMVKAAYSSGKPAYGVGAGNATMVIDETADIQEAARNTRLSKTSDNGSGCSADGNLLVEESIYDRFLECLQAEDGLLLLRCGKRTVGVHSVGLRGAPHYEYGRPSGLRARRNGWNPGPIRKKIPDCQRGQDRQRISFFE